MRTSGVCCAATADFKQIEDKPVLIVAMLLLITTQFWRLLEGGRLPAGFGKATGNSSAVRVDSLYSYWRARVAGPC